MVYNIWMENFVQLLINLANMLVMLQWIVCCRAKLYNKKRHAEKIQMKKT